MIEVTVVVNVPGMKGRYSMPQGGILFEDVPLVELFPLCLLAFQARVTIGD